MVASLGCMYHNLLSANTEKGPDAEGNGRSVAAISYLPETLCTCNPTASGVLPFIGFWSLSNNYIPRESESNNEVNFW